MTDKPKVNRTAFHGDDGQAADALVKAICEYRERNYNRTPELLVVGVDLYEALVVNSSTVSDHGYVSVPYHDKFMGIPLVVVPDKGFARAVGSPHDMMMLYGGTTDDAEEVKS